MRANQQVDMDILQHILRYCCNVKQLIERFGADIEIFKADLAYRDSVSMNILQIGELAGKLSEEYRKQTQDKLPWSAMKRMRNFFAHNYGNMDVNVIWATAVNNIPEVKEFCEEHIRFNESVNLEADDEIDI